MFIAASPKEQWHSTLLDVAAHETKDKMVKGNIIPFVRTLWVSSWLCLITQYKMTNWERSKTNIIFLLLSLGSHFSNPHSLQEHANISLERNLDDIIIISFCHKFSENLKMGALAKLQVWTKIVECFFYCFLVLVSGQINLFSPSGKHRCTYLVFGCTDLQLG